MTRSDCFRSVSGVQVFNKARNLGLVLFLGLAMAACGGGGGGGAVSSSGDTTAPSVVSITPTDNSVGVAISGATIAVTFSETMSASSLSALNFSLSGPGGPVAGDVTTGDNLTFSFVPHVTLAHSTTYIVTVNTGARDAAGNALASQYSARFTTVAAPDTTGPTVSATTPARGATGVATNSIVSVTFSEPMDCASVQDAFAVASLGGTVACNGNNTGATFTPSSPLVGGSTYDATISTAATDVIGNPLGRTTGNPLGSPYTWSFTAAAIEDNTPPSVTTTNPAHGATGIPVNSTVSATFSEPMNPASINGTSFMLTGPGSTTVSGSVSYNGLTAVFTPSTPLSHGILYSASISNNVATGVADLAGNKPANPKSWTFTTAAVGTPADTTPPSVTSTTPADGATGVAANSVVTAAFSEPLACASVTSASFLVNSGAISGNVGCSGNVVTFTPSPALNNGPTGTVYTVTLTGGITDAVGNALAANRAWSFTTAAVADPAPTDTTAPTVFSKTPVADGVAIDTQLKVTFSEDIDCTSVSTASFLLSGSGPISGTINCLKGSVTFTPSIALAYSTSHTATLTTTIKDLAGNVLAAPYLWNFTTTNAPDTTSPTVLSWTPASAATGVSPNAVVSVTFSEPVNCATVTTSSFSVTPTIPAGSTLAGSISCSGNNASFTPNAPLDSSTTYTVNLTGITDLAAINPNMLVPASWNFTTLWTRQPGTSSYDQSNAITTDSAGNTYITGATLGAMPGHTNAGGWDIFLTKYDSVGVHEWTKQIGTARDEIAYGVATDSGNNVYITGYTGGNLDGGAIPTTHDIFLVKYNNSGERQWTKQFGTTHNEIAFGIASDGVSVYITGNTYGSLTGTNFGTSDWFLAKYDTNGAQVWLRQFGSDVEDVVYAIASDGVVGGDVYLTGHTYGYLLPGLPGTTPRAEDVFLAKYNAAGDKLWVEQIGTGSTDAARSVTVIGSNVYVAGNTSGTLPIGTSGARTSNSGESDAFLINYTTSGGPPLWTTQFGTSATEHAYGVVAFGSDIYLTGHTSGTLSGNTSAGDIDVFLAKFNNAGIVQWRRQIGSSMKDTASGVAYGALPPASIYVTGTTLGSLDGNNNLGLSDGFVLKYSTDGDKR